MDVGVSLMYAPHPSVIPFEFATTGALVVTNVYENRSGEQLRAICGNIIPCESSLPGVIQAIREAVSRVADFSARQAQAYVPASASWREVFNKAFVESFAGPVPQPRSEAAGVPIGGRVRKLRAVAAKELSTASA